MTKEEKALLDMIAYSEGTLGVSNNGYDVLVGYRKIVGWTPDTTIVHQNSKWFDKSNNSSAAGRYQFLYDTWIGNSKKNLPMNKINQDKRGIELINHRIGSIDKTTLTSFNSFKQATDKLALTWASIPLSTTGRSYYNKDGINHTKVSLNQLFEVYKKALALYS